MHLETIFEKRSSVKESALILQVFSFYFLLHNLGWDKTIQLLNWENKNISSLPTLVVKLKQINKSEVIKPVIGKLEKFHSLGRDDLPNRKVASP